MGALIRGGKVPLEQCGTGTKLKENGALHQQYVCLLSLLCSDRVGIMAKTLRQPLPFFFSILFEMFIAISRLFLSLPFLTCTLLPFWMQDYVSLLSFSSFCSPLSLPLYLSVSHSQTLPYSHTSSSYIPACFLFCCSIYTFHQELLSCIKQHRTWTLANMCPGTQAPKYGTPNFKFMVHAYKL